MPDDENKGISDGADISGMFKSLGKKSPREIRIEPSYFETPKIIQWTMKYSRGLIKNEKQAQYAILGFVLLAIIISVLVVSKRSPGKLGSEEKAFLDREKSTESYDTKLFSQ